MMLTFRDSFYRFTRKSKGKPLTSHRIPQGVDAVWCDGRQPAGPARRKELPTPSSQIHIDVTEGREVQECQTNLSDNRFWRNPSGRQLGRKQQPRCITMNSYRCPEYLDLLPCVCFILLAQAATTGVAVPNESNRRAYRCCR